jgi:hypothetical protein
MNAQAPSYTSLHVSQTQPTYPGGDASKWGGSATGARFISLCALTMAAWAGVSNVTGARGPAFEGRINSRATIARSLFDCEQGERSDVIAELEKLIHGYARREPNWDGMGGSPPSNEAVADATAFLSGLVYPAPDSVYAPGDGEVMFQWRRPSSFVEVGFYGDGTISWFGRTSGAPPTHGDEPFLRERASDLPEPLSQVLSLLA